MKEPHPRKPMAERWISVELKTDDSTGAKMTAFMKGLFNVAMGDTTAVGPSTQIILSDRDSKRPIHVQDWGNDYQAALNAKATFEEELRSLDVGAFCEKYLIDWKPSKPAKDADS